MIHLTPFEPAHAKPLAALLAEMDSFYGTTDLDPLPVRLQQIHDALLSDTPAAHVLLAWDGTEPADGAELVGLAAYSFLWPAIGLTRSLYLKELYVAQTRRREGIGQRLMQSLYDLARKHGCSRVEWTTDTNNDDAQAFYTALNAETNTGKIFYRIEGNALEEPTE